MVVVVSKLLPQNTRHHSPGVLNNLILTLRPLSKLLSHGVVVDLVLQLLSLLLEVGALFEGLDLKLGDLAVPLHDLPFQELYSELLLLGFCLFFCKFLAKTLFTFQNLLLFSKFLDVSF